MPAYRYNRPGAVRRTQQPGRRLTEQPFQRGLRVRVGQALEIAGYSPVRLPFAQLGTGHTLIASPELLKSQVPLAKELLQPRPWR